MAYWSDLNQVNRRRSFTLLETLVAIYVLLAGIVGTMNLAQQNISAITLFRHQLIAAGLAQEGAELVRSRRDSNAIRCYYDSACFNWADPTDNPNKENMLGLIDASVGCNTGRGCRVESPLGDATGLINFELCGVTSCGFLKFDELTGLYQYSAGNDTIFDRHILLEPGTDRDSTSADPDLHDWKIISTVRWCEKLDCSREVQVTEILTPHIDRT